MPAKPSIKKFEDDLNKRARVWILENWGLDLKPLTEGKELDPVARKTFESHKHSLALGLAKELGIKRKMLIVPITKEEENQMPKMDKDTEAKQKPESAVERKTKTVETEHGEFRSPSVLLSIYKGFALKDGVTKAELLERLIAEFPDREAEQMTSTINTQINRMPIERKFKLGRSEKGRYGLQIEGWATNRVYTPEQMAERKEAAEAKAAEKAKGKAEKVKALKAKAEKNAPKGVPVKIVG